MRAVKYSDRILEAVEHEVIPFPGAVRSPGDLADFLTEREAWSVIHAIRRRNLAEQRRQLFLRRVFVGAFTIKDAVMWAWRCARQIARKVGVKRPMP